MHVANYYRTFSFIEELLLNNDYLMLAFSNFILLSNYSEVCSYLSVSWF